MGAATAIPMPRAVTFPHAEERVQHRFVIFMLCVWCGWVVLKFSNVQLLEIFMLLHMVFLGVGFLLRGFRTRIYGLWIRPGIWYGAIMLAILAIDVLDLRLPRFPPEFMPAIMANPLLLLAGRYVELFICVFYSMYAAELMRRDPRLRYYGLRMYLGSALVSCWYSILAYPLWRIGIESGVYGEGRGRGGFPEGGPWGLYLISVCVVARVLFVRGHMSRRYARFTIASVALGLVLAQSKAAMLAAVLIFLFAVFVKSTWQQKVATLCTTLVVGVVVWFALDVPGQIRGIQRLRKSAELLVFLDRANPSTAYGRVAASVIVPNMLAAHWLTGIGWGNYPVMRNTPQYRGIMPPVISYDLPGLGLLSEAAELGLPALAALYVIMFYPVYLAGKTRSHRLVAMLALVAPVAFAAGAQLTLFYPWLMTAFALSFLPLQHGRASRVPPTALVPAGVGV